MYNYSNQKEAPLSPLKPLSDNRLTQPGYNNYYDEKFKRSLICKYQNKKCNKSLKEILKIYSRFLNDQLIKYSGYKSSRIDLEDIQNEIVIGFIDAINNFDLKSPHPLISFSLLYIKGKVLSYVLDNKYICRIPKTTINQTLIFKLNILKQDLKINNDFIDDNHINLISKKYKTSKNTIVKTLNQLNKNEISFSEKVKNNFGEESEITEGEIEYFNQNNEVKEEKNVISSNLIINRENLIKDAFIFLEKINQRQKNILEEIYFKNSCLNTLSKKYKISKPRISLIKKQGIKNLKKYFKKNNIELLNFLEC